MKNFTLYNDDCLNVLMSLEDNSIDSCVTDPPYGLSMMGKTWDYDVPKKEIWMEVLRVLKPGGHVLAFFGSRTYHRGAIQIEDAGFEIRDQIMWLYGSGFPKSHNIKKDMDRMAGANKTIKERWMGWGTAFKPAHEPIVVARKPIEEKSVAENVLKYGTGAINIDECRIKTESEDGMGRWPANVIHDGSDEVVNLFPYSKSPGLTPEQQVRGGWAGTKNVYGSAKRGGTNTFPPSEGSASRFFYSAKISKSDRDEGLENFLYKRFVFFQTKGGTSGVPSSLGKNKNTEYKNTHPTVKPTSLMEYLITAVTQKGGIVLDPFMGSGSTGKACGFKGFKFVGIERDKDYYEIAAARIDHAYRGKTANLEKFFE